MSDVLCWQLHVFGFMFHCFIFQLFLQDGDAGYDKCQKLSGLIGKLCTEYKQQASHF